MIRQGVWRNTSNMITGHILGCEEFIGDLVMDHGILACFYTPQIVELTTTKNRKQSDESVKEVPIDFVYNIIHSDGMSTTGHDGAAFLGDELQYTGFTRYDKSKRIITADEGRFNIEEVENTEDFRRELREYYGKYFNKFEENIKSLPLFMKLGKIRGRAIDLLLGE